jgi:hypothetical protein
MITTRRHTRLCHRQLIERQVAHRLRLRSFDAAQDLAGELPLAIRLVKSKPGRLRIQVYSSIRRRLPR